MLSTRPLYDVPFQRPRPSRDRLRTAVFLAARVALLLLAPPVASDAAAQTPADADASASCAPPRALGITGYACRCHIDGAPGQAREWTFDTELEILVVDGTTPGGRMLRPGDVVVAVDGQLITTGGGQRRWSGIRPGDSVSLRVRRGPRVLDLRVPATAQGCRENTDPIDSDPLAESRAFTPRKRLLPRGWLGVGLACSCTVSTGDDTPLWTFHSLPTITRVVADGPAARAGLQPGDLLLRVNGEPLDTEPGGRAFSAITPGSALLLDIQRDGRVRTIRVVADTVPSPR